MSRNNRTPRGTEAPMDYEWTNRTPIKPSWSQAAMSEDTSTPRKRPHDEVNPPTTPFGQPRSPMFGSNQNVPFIFNQNATPRTPNPPPWQPPPHFSPEKAFPNSPEPNDVDMSEVSPNKGEEQAKSENGRAVAVGGLRRVFNARKKTQSFQMARRRRSQDSEDEDVFDSDEEADALVQNTSNHYTLNMPAAPPPQSDLPYILLGYTQFIFNMSLILLFLYLIIQFILTVQRDVEQRISEYSMDIVQEIAICSLQYKTNLCERNAVPAMAQQCENWKTCMNRDPAIVGRAKVGAEMIAEVVNGFVEPISWKALVSLVFLLSLIQALITCPPFLLRLLPFFGLTFPSRSVFLIAAPLFPSDQAFTLTSLSFLTVFINSLLSLFRARQHPAAPPAPSHPLQAQPTLPYPQHFGPGSGFLTPAPTPSWGRTGSRSRVTLPAEDEGLQTPTRRRRRIEGGASLHVN
ncbi:hypothetical protein DXG01_005744 [Tephrocybe rancida]|nr:hypothetical protein DXG01_005744 [Tephrocybe rancida]